MSSIEQRRKELQIQLDAQKSQKERNKMGQFSTPYPLALEMMQYIRDLVSTDEISFIEPSIGTGVFYSAYREVFSNSHQHALGFEIDPLYFFPTQNFWKDSPLELRCSDFLSQRPDKKFDILVANPPYVRHHHIDGTTKRNLQESVLLKTGIKISGLAGLYCYFMMLSSAWLKDGGLSCWLVPCEFMDANYGEAIRRYLLQNVELIHVHRFKEDDLQFTDALVSSCIVVFRKSKPTKKQIRFSIGGSINTPEMSILMDRVSLKPETKWSIHFTQNAKFEESSSTLGDFFTVKRGIATGDNDFFILSKETIEQYNIPQDFLRPVLPSPRYIKENRINNENGLPLVPNQLFLFCCNLPENILKERYPKVWEYVQTGYERGVQKGYICSRRSPWYSCEERKPATFVMPYMGRGETGNRMFRFILNTSDAVTTNVYLLLYPKPQYARCMKDERVLNEVWQELNTIPIEALTQNGRSYGGGLHKMEPKELMRTPVKGIASLLDSNVPYKQLSLFG